jgi:hypothetical protein
VSLRSRTAQLLARLSFGKAARARREEALGRLEQATLHYVEAGELEQAARLCALRADAATEPEERLKLLGQAIGFSDKEAARPLAIRRARLKLDLVKSREGALGKSELASLGRELEELGEPALAAEVHALSGDTEAEARALVLAGAVERLEQVLESEQRRERSERERDRTGQRARDLFASGRRREALTLARDRGDEKLLALVREIETRRSSVPRAVLVIDGQRLELCFGESVVVGRGDAGINLGSPSVSREHLMIRRGRSGPEIVDLGSRNGTTLCGARLDAPVSLGKRLELLLGNEVRLMVEPWQAGVRLQLGERSVHAPLGPLSVGSWSIAPGVDGWLELAAQDGQPPWLGDLRAELTIELCKGDELREHRDGPVRMRVAG